MMNSGVRLVKERFNPRFSYRGVDLSTPSKEGLRDIPVRVPGQSGQLTSCVRLPAPQFDRLKQPTQDPMPLQQVPHEFKRFVAREAGLDDELWTAAWLRAECHWEDRQGDRYAENLKRKFAEQEFSSMKRRYKGQYGPRCMCIVAVWMDWDNVKHLATRSVVGTLDLTIRRLLWGETFPGERVRPFFFCRIEGTRHNSTYGYIANLCVAKSARCQGIATSMMKFTIELAKASGVEQVYAHVHRHNRSARELYSKLGFEIVAEATDQLEEDKQYLLCLDI